MTRCLPFLIVALLPFSAISAEELLPANRPIPEVIDHYIQAGYKADNITPAPQLADAETIRRITLDLAGRIPTWQEVKDYTNSAEPQKREQLVDRLLATPDYAWHQANELDLFLLATEKRDDQFREYLRICAEENRPWDQMFREMLLGSEDEQSAPALEFLKARASSVDDMTNDTSRVFFGISINCAKCHDHPLVADWLQDHFYGMASFFNRTYLTKSQILAEKYSGQMKFKTTAGKEKTAAFMFLTGAVVEEPEVQKTKQQQQKEDQEVQRQMKDAKAPPPKTPDFQPRKELVELALKSENQHFFAKSIVNRMWVRLYGTGLVDPPDQMHSANPPSHPELLDWLARDLIAHKYDLKRLLRGMVLSQTYSLSSAWTADSEPPGPWTFAVAKTRVMTPRQYGLSLLFATTSPTRLEQITKPEDWKSFRDGYERTASSLASRIELPSNNFQVSVDEALMFSNDSRIQNDYLRDSGDKLVGYLKEIENEDELITAAFWNILSREPEAAELSAFKTYFDQRKEERIAGIQQIVWALITSPELRFNY